MSAKRPAIVVGLALILLTQTGCLSVVKHAYYEARGAKAEVKVNGATNHNLLASCGDVEFAPATTTLDAELCPPRVLRYYDEHARKLAERFNGRNGGGSSALRITSDIQYFAPKGLLGSAMMLTRVKLTSAGSQVLDAVVVAESKSFRAGGGNALAEASVSGLGKYLGESRDDGGDADED